MCIYSPFDLLRFSISSQLLNFLRITVSILQADTVFLSPPWGGPDYAKVQTYNIKTMLQPCDGFDFLYSICLDLVVGFIFWFTSLRCSCFRYFLFNTARGIASRVVMFLPRNVDLNQLAELSLSAHPPWALEVFLPSLFVVDS